MATGRGRQVKAINDPFMATGLSSKTRGVSKRGRVEAWWRGSSEVRCAHDGHAMAQE